MPPVDQWMGANALPLDGTYYPFDLEEEADEEPVNTGLFEAGVGWLRANARGQGASCIFFVGVVGEVLGSARDYYLAFLEVFRL